MRRGTCIYAVAAVAAVALLSSTARADNWFGSVGLSIGRVLDTPNHGDAVVFANHDQQFTPVGSSVFGAQFSLPLTPKSGDLKLFGQFATTQPAGSTAYSPDSSGAQILGLQFNVLGAQSSVALENASGPAVFAFYNFPQAQNASPFGNLFGSRPAAANALTGQPGVLPVNQDLSATSSLAFPLVSSLSAEGPFWYGGNSPALQGSSVQLSIPLHLAKLGVKVRLGEQSLTALQPSSLANQILGPAFASSLSNYNSFNGGVTLALPLLNRRATVSLDGLYQSLQQNAGLPLTIPGAGQETSMPSIPASGPIVFSPAATDLQQYVGSATLAVPVTSRLTVKGSVAEQVAGNVDLSTLTQSLTQHTTAYAGGLVYTLPKSNSSINFFFNRNVYSDDAVPTSNWAENRQNLYFSVKF